MGFNGYIAKDIDEKVLFSYNFPVRFGISEWINFDLAYTSGISLGIKGRIWGETGKIMPSIAVGVHNLFTHKEASYFSVDSAEDMSGEIYVACSKNADRIKTRFHFGVQSIPALKSDLFNPFFAVEKYFGIGLYTALEFYRRQKEYNIALFASWRIFKRRLQISAGAVDLKNMFLDKNNKFSISLTPPDSAAFIKPGIWVGVTYYARFGLGKNAGFMTAEDRFRKQDAIIDSLVKEVDSLGVWIKETKGAVANIQGALHSLVDSIENDPSKMKNIILGKLVGLKNLYQSEPFEPDKVKFSIREIASYRDDAVPCLEEFLLDQKTDRYVRMYSAMLLGIIGNTGSSDVLLDVLAQSHDPDIQIEVLIALGKMKETRAIYLMEQLANSPHDAVALAAQEVLRQLSKETGAVISSDLNLRNAKNTDNATNDTATKSSTDSAVSVHADSIADRAVNAAVDSITHMSNEQKSFEEQDLQSGQRDTVQITQTPDSTLLQTDQTPGDTTITKKELEEEAAPESENTSSRRKRRDKKKKDESEEGDDQW